MQDRIEHLQSVAGVSPVDQALMLVRQMASRPISVFDPYSLIGALENLEDVVRRSAHNDVRRYAAVLSNCKKLQLTTQMGDFVTQVLGDDVEKEVAKMMGKVYKGPANSYRVMLPPATFPRPSRGMPYPSAPGPRPVGSVVRCFYCRRLGHFARNCPQKK